MKVLLTFLSLSSLILWTACDNEIKQLPVNSDELIGYYYNVSVVNDSTYTYKRTNALPEDAYGFAFKSGDVFIERKTIGWCATPPVSYDDFEGTWSYQDSIVNIIVPYWGGWVESQWKIMENTNKQITIMILNQEYYNIEF